VLDRRLVEDVASRLRSDPGLVEKDWHVTRAISVLASFDHGGAQPAFGGGTSLSKAWGLIKRFSEDIDFKVAMPAASSQNKARNERSAYRERVLGALTAAGFALAGEPTKRDASHFFSSDLFYPSIFAAGAGLRPHIRVEMSLRAPTLPAIPRPIGSLIAAAQRQPPEVPTFFCVDPVETAADKLSALAWRVHARKRGSADDDPTIIRHLHDLAALKATVEISPGFATGVLDALAGDAGRGGGTIGASDPATLFTGVFERLSADPLWAAEYEDYVRQVSFAAPDEQIDFNLALAAVRNLAMALTDRSPS
jgi:Nucleotidyl transferase AbiEii toxin, Type IV TA system